MERWRRNPGWYGSRRWQMVGKAWIRFSRRRSDPGKTTTVRSGVELRLDRRRNPSAAQTSERIPCDRPGISTKLRFTWRRTYSTAKATAVSTSNPPGATRQRGRTSWKILPAIVKIVEDVIRLAEDIFQSNATSTRWEVEYYRPRNINFLLRYHDWRWPYSKIISIMHAWVRNLYRLNALQA